ncbi:MAG: hypothetical protein COV55_05160 [Candidatus Komeilibacteria bacterium CG11_big_fil_rev_8_21_14_0_20_36_20]|uniref:Uncharacterized protein n=1 Tax=Candidatus Komeilibacteria bacterium CG11_big_fil_rev_8_21_14_0_20_36_20 TaxID=1974477 RepID=A0A2H0NB36_9BACT|nr:MAG: hypothetical protein COV55_05160 [Candidatus Komeilibacteria bacterium CG11_big_fil_rev_8_21_14_0_20_36_20]PIR82087.1 MAG: hypothetical protein COU21_00405 [Candidatus Komeilibacteria bacterium CG10_big_fil_rev_8_21_14_0_10_36_65]PJC55692.1 MAG: hypothetical protein CO027_00665 [Candidatus Komeilibacteria bacterium CG_4_9_14_0_2_um_filter_36_13]
MFDIILIIIAVLSIAFILRLFIKKIPYLVNVNVDSLPEIRLKRQKEAILKNRLGRLWQTVWAKVKNLSVPASDKLGEIFKDYYQKLKALEKDLKRRSNQQLTSAVDKSQATDQMIIQAKQLMNTEDYKQAEEVLLDVLSLDQSNLEAYQVLAEVYRSRKEYEQAKETLEYLLRLTNNENAAVYSSLADIARDRGNLKQAEEDYLKSISLSKDNYLYFLSLAEVYFDLEEYEQALQTAQRALLLAPNNPKILDFLIEISIIMQDKELSLEYLDKLKEVNPDNNKILDFLERIDQLK